MLSVKHIQSSHLPRKWAPSPVNYYFSPHSSCSGFFLLLDLVGFHGLESSSSRFSPSGSSPFRSRLKCHLLWEDFPEHQTRGCGSPDHHTLVTIILSIIFCLLFFVFASLSLACKYTNSLLYTQLLAHFCINEWGAGVDRYAGSDTQLVKTGQG